VGSGGAERRRARDQLQTGSVSIVNISWGLLLWTFISVAIVAVVISVIARALFRRGRVKK